MLSGFFKLRRRSILTDPVPTFPSGTRNAAQILESIDAKLSEVLKFTKFAGIVLIVWIVLGFVGICVWVAMVLGILARLARP